MLKVKFLIIIIAKFDNNTLSKHEVKRKYVTIIKLYFLILWIFYSQINNIHFIIINKIKKNILIHQLNYDWNDRINNGILKK